MRAGVFHRRSEVFLSAELLVILLRPRFTSELLDRLGEKSHLALIGFSDEVFLPLG